MSHRLPFAAFSPVSRVLLVTTLLLMLPLLAMQFSSEVRWGPLDFAAAAALLNAAGLAWLWSRRRWHAARPRRLAALAILLLLAGVWAELAVGIFD
ncbi:MAG: hypothetical protein KBC73_09740 [Burkholderiaceae bacterium]|nr:hypothetical protein [Burkholderiaceae bacterium]